LPGTVPSATILIVNSTRYKINGIQAIAFTEYRLSKSRTTILVKCSSCLTYHG
jgi:hypothetical protein